MITTITSPAIALKPIVASLSSVTEDLLEVLEQRQDVYVGLSEKLKESTIGLVYEDQIDALDHAYDSLLDALAYLEDIIGRRNHVR